MSRESLVFEVDLPPRELSSNRSHDHWRGRNRATGEYRGLVKLLAQNAANRAKWPVAICGAYRVSLVFGVKGSRRVRRYAPRDEANAVAAFKAGFDGLVDADLLVDDSKRYMAMGDVAIDASVGPFVRVTIEPVGGPGGIEEVLR